MVYVDLWGWFYDVARSAVRDGDQQRVQLTRLYWQSQTIRLADPHQSLAMLRQGSELAERLDEPCLKIFFDYWACEVYIFDLEDLNAGLEYATKVFVEACKPGHSHCPVLGRVYRVMMDAYIYSDPAGYAVKVHDLLAYMEQNVPMDDDTGYLLHGRRVDLAWALDQPDQAFDLALKYLEVSEHSAFRKSHAYSVLSAFSYLKDEVSTALEYALLYEQHARRTDWSDSVATALVWQAMLYRKLGEEDKSRECHRRGLAQRSRLGVMPGGLYYDAMCYHAELGGESETALHLRDEQLGALAGKGMFGFETHVHLQRCRLRGRMGLLEDADLATARTAGQPLKAPQYFLAELDRIVQGDYSDKPRAWL
jgi:hypothetical protein